MKRKLLYLIYFSTGAFLIAWLISSFVIPVKPATEKPKLLDNHINVIDQPTANLEIGADYKPGNNLKTNTSPEGSIISPEIPTKHDENLIPVTIIIGKTKYAENIPINSSAFDAMTLLAADKKITLTDKYYPGLGNFISEINGIKNENGFYWTFYINNTYSLVGASTLILARGDTVEWRYENDEVEH